MIHGPGANVGRAGDVRDGSLAARAPGRGRWAGGHRNRAGGRPADTGTRPPRRPHPRDRATRPPSPPSSARSSRRTTARRRHRRRRHGQDARHRGARALAPRDEGGDLRGGLAAEPTPRHGDPFEGPLVPEQILVLTYNVKAAQELQERLDAVVGPAVRARMTVSNFHSFCQHVLTESQRGRRPARAAPTSSTASASCCSCATCGPAWACATTRDCAFPGFVQFINRAKDELVDPDDFDRFVAAEREVYERRYGSFDEAVLRLEAQGNLEPLRKVRPRLRGPARQRARGGRRRAARVRRPRVREGHRPRGPPHVAGDGHAHDRNQFAAEDHDRIDTLADEYERDGAALEILRLDGARPRLPRLRGGARARAAPWTSASRSPSSRGCSRPGPTSCAAGSASSATSSSTSSRTPTSPRSSSSSSWAAPRTAPTT